ncbi:MAG: methyltransferase domain-containing protein [Verrucomicrobia bacterium]|nr:methyltransferase domain-containing protein [Verrucomicrobiota bacterium]
MTPRSSKDQFNANADKYAISDVHRAGPSLPVLLQLAQPVQSDVCLDVATGTGHTALAVARFVSKTIGIDIAPKMLEQARRLVAEQAVSNCVFMEGSAEEIPLAGAQFTLVTARHAPHHFHHVGRFLSEVRRVLAPQGRFLMADQISASAEVFDWVNYWERTRDPSHFMQRTVEQWREEATKAGFSWVEHSFVPYRLEFDWWVEQAGCTEPVVSSLVEHAAQAPQPVRDLLNLEFDSTGRVLAFQEPMLVVRLE